MEIRLRKDPIIRWEEGFASRRKQTDTAEMVVPDSMPDIQRILDVEASVYHQDRMISEGRVTLSGEIHGTVLYWGDADDQIQKMEIRFPWNVSAEDPAVLETDRLVSQSSVTAAEARILNPRKIAWQVETVTDLKFYRAVTEEIPVGAEEENLQTLIRKDAFGYVASVEEKSFVVSEELSLPAARPALEKLLWYRANTQTDEQKTVGGKMILQGSVELEIGYQGETEPMPVLERFTVPFSQILDIPEGASGSAQAVIQSGACHVEPMPGTYGAGTLHMEIYLTAQVVFRASREIAYLADAYSVRYACTEERTKIACFSEDKPISLRDTVRGSLKADPPADEVLYCRAWCGPASLEDGAVDLPVIVHILYRTDQGTLAGASGCLEASLRLQRPGGGDVILSAPVLGEPYVTAAGDNLDIRMPVEMSGLPLISRELDCISALDLDTETPWGSADTPSLTVIRWGEESLWDLAKRYGSTMALVEAANPDMALGELLLIPRAR